MKLKLWENFMFDLKMNEINEIKYLKAANKEKNIKHTWLVLIILLNIFSSLFVDQ